MSSFFFILKAVAFIHTLDRLKNFLKILAVGITKRTCAGCINVTATKSDSRESCKTDRCSACTAILDSDDVISLALGNTKSNGCRLGIKPGMRLGRKLAKGAYATLSEWEAGRNCTVIELLRLTHIESAEGGENLRPRLLVKAAGNEGDLDAHLLQGIEEFLQSLTGSKGALLSSSGHDLLHLTMGVLEVEISCTGETLTGTVLVDAILKMLGYRVARNKGLILVRKLEIGIAKKRCGGLLDNPDPEALASNAGAVKIHKNSLNRTGRIYRLNRIICRIIKGGKNVRKSVILKADELYLAVAGSINTLYAALANLKFSIATLIKNLETVALVKHSEVGNIYSHFYTSRIRVAIL